MTAHNSEAVARLVTRLEGIPLAIELAAAWSRLLTPAQMLARLSDPFEMLVSRNRRVVVPERQRTLWGALAWGYDLLPPDARRVFAALSVFRGDWSAAAAEAVCEGEEGEEGKDGEQGLVSAGRTIECLMILQAASLLVTDETADEMRFRLLETVREFAAALLTESEQERVERRHATFFLARAEEAYLHRSDASQKIWFDRLAADLPNYRAALGRFAETETGLQMASALGYFWKLRGYYREGQAWLKRVLAAGRETGDHKRALTPSLSRAWNAAAIIAEDLGDYAVASGFYVQCAAAYRTQGCETNLPGVITSQGNIAYRQGMYPEARGYYEESLTISRRLNDMQGIASALGSLGNVAQAQRNYEEARRFQEESLALSRLAGDDRMTAYTLHNLGNLAMSEHDMVRARALYEESLPKKRALGDRRGVATLESSLGFLELEEKHAAEAAVSFADSLRVLLELGNKVFLISVLEGAAWCAAQMGEPEQAARVWAAARAARDVLSAPLTEQDRDSFDLLIAEARTSAASPTTFDRAWENGSAFSLDEAVRCALSHLDTTTW